MKTYFEKKIHNFIERIAWRTAGIVEKELFWKLFSDIGVDNFKKILNEKEKQGVQYVNLAEMYIEIMRKIK